MSAPKDRSHDRAVVGNPKDLVGQTRAPLDLVPVAGNYYAAEAMLEGALKYGQYNWRIAGVRASIYYAALLSHAAKWFNGQDRDPVTLVHELGAARACIDILIDAIECNMLGDDRPPPMPPFALDRLRSSPTIQRLLETYPPDRDDAPHQWTINDVTRIQHDKNR